MKLLGRKMVDQASYYRGVGEDVIVEMTADEYKGLLGIAQDGAITQEAVDSWRWAKQAIGEAAKALSVVVLPPTAKEGDVPA
jgi:hypothetical protein